MDLSCDLMGIKLKNPLILSSGPMSRSGEMMIKALEAGAGAVVTETILNEIRPNVRPRLTGHDGALQNIRLYSEYSLEEWKRQIGMVKEHGGIVIANILAHSPSEMAFLGRTVERYGADALELGVSSPHGEGLSVLGCDPPNLYQTVKKVVESVKIPVMVKLSPNVNNLASLAKAAEDAGARGISAINTIRSILGVDIESMSPYLPTYGGYSGDPIRPIGLGAVATICQTVELSVSGIGGISQFNHLLEYIMLGARTCQLQSALIFKGLGVIGEILDGLSAWMESRGYNSLDEFRGKALNRLKSFDEIILEPKVAMVARECPRPDCSLCETACVYSAVAKDRRGKIQVDTDRCTGCGLCLSVCPESCFTLEWKR
ncbi:4Fe-4S binding protein [Spirochaeta isovalerica]|uniref:dihydrouracil dehydrogenase (NAD(+)) n=1 Tax=Spirochaeta isovalerica TaxID=150 RepID=A0A841R6U1_9SPIO|nr:4Fe-4S binding protein [Spirochaeta isovalerica]MBB6479565.1 dihydroorotate dehydrogenase subfamily 1 [Spirochaeta isovalerica]